MVELAILRVFVDTYGVEMLTNNSLGDVLRLFARYGGVAVARHVLWGEPPADRQLALMLSSTRMALTRIAFSWPDIFLADANAVIARFMPRSS